MPHPQFWCGLVSQTTQKELVRIKPIKSPHREFLSGSGLLKTTRSRLIILFSEVLEAFENGRLSPFSTTKEIIDNSH